MANDAQVPGLAGGGVVITGASSGIGKACALYLDQRGYRVFAGVRKASDGEALTKVSVVAPEPGDIGRDRRKGRLRRCQRRWSGLWENFR